MGDFDAPVKHPQAQEWPPPPRSRPVQPGPPGPPPGFYGYAPGMPSTNIGWAIAAVMTFWPCAIPAFVYSARVERLFWSGDPAAARHASNLARGWGIAGVAVGVVLFVPLVVLGAHLGSTLH